MRKNKFSLLVAFVAWVVVGFMVSCISAQNLVRNPGFDTIVRCPHGLQNLTDIYPPDNWLQEYTADHFHECATGVANAPNAYFGYAPGNAYAGFLGAVYNPDTTTPLFSMEYVKQGVSLPPGAEIHIGAKFFRGMPLPGTYGPASSVLFIFSQDDTIQTQLLLDQGQWISFDTTIVLESQLDTLKIGAGGSVEPYNGVPYAGYYYIDDVFIEIVSLPVSASPSPEDVKCVWEDIPLQNLPFKVQRCLLHGEVRKVVVLRH